MTAAAQPYRRGYGHRRGIHRHRPAAVSDHYNPCSEYHVTANDCSHLPKQLGGRRTTPNFWRVMVAIADMSQDGVPCYLGLRKLALRSGLSMETVIKYRQLGAELKMVRLESRAGKGSGRQTTLSVPIRSPYWGAFHQKAESENRSKSLTLLELDDVKSDVVSKRENRVVPIDAVSTARPAPTPIEAEDFPQNEQSTIVSTPSWPVSTLIAAVLAILGLRLQAADALSILRTCRRRELTRHTPEAVISAVLEAGREEYGQFAALKITSAGAYVHSVCKRLPTEQIKAAGPPEPPPPPPRYTYRETVRRLSKQPPAPMRRPTEVLEKLGFDLKLFDESELPAAPPPRTVDREYADNLLRKNGIDPDEFIEWTWEHANPKPSWPMTPDDFNALLAQAVNRKSTK